MSLEKQVDVNDCGRLYVLPIYRKEKENLEEGINYFVDVYRFCMLAMPVTAAVYISSQAPANEPTSPVDDEIKALADEGIFLHYDSIKRVFEE